ncbi:MAG: hypothetical protein WBV71_07175 [Roseobacter sp.]
MNQLRRILVNGRRHAHETRQHAPQALMTLGNMVDSITVLKTRPFGDFAIASA